MNAIKIKVNANGHKYPIIIGSGNNNINFLKY